MNMIFALDVYDVLHDDLMFLNNKRPFQQKDVFKIRKALIKALIKFIRMRGLLSDKQTIEKTKHISRDLISMIQDTNALTLESKFSHLLFYLNINIFKHTCSELRSIRMCLPSCILDQIV